MMVFPAADLLRDLCHEDRADGHAGQRGAEQDAQIRPAQPPGFGNRRRTEGHDQDVVAVNEV